MPIITISRGTLAGAERLAESVAEELGLPCISREVIVDAARGAGIAEETLVEQMDRPPSFFTRHSRERDVYLWHVRAALCQHALMGSFVYHGHGGNLLLSDVANVLRVNVVASLEFRVAAVMKSHGWAADKAGKHVRKMDKQRETWVRYLYQVDWREPSLYDLTLNLEKLSLADACQLLVQCARLPRFAWTDEAKQNVADVALATRVSAALAQGGELYLGNIQLTAEDNVLTVHGRVRSRRAGQEIQAAVEKVRGEAEVRYDLQQASEDIHWGFESPA